MYPILLPLHSIVRWLVLIFLLYAIYRSALGYSRNRTFTRTDNAIRHWTATLAHIQLMIGMILYVESPFVKAYWKNRSAVKLPPDLSFFSIIHIAMMFTAVVILTIGSAMARRQQDDQRKFRTMLFWFIIALLIIFIAIPWPFSPLAKRPLIRS
jgi:ABC-type Na+ efflux pump permease subunit